MNSIKFEPLSEFDKECLMPISSFKQGAEYHCYTDYDGYGYYATETEISDMYIDFKDIISGNIPDWCTHVCWFNK